MAVNYDAYSALRVPAFRRYLIATSLVSMGTAAQGLAIGWEVYERTNEQLDLLYAYVKATDTDIRIFVQTGNWRCSNTGTGRPGPHTSEYFQSELKKMEEWQRDFDPGNRARG